jgi:hypothetical protein
MPDDETPRSLYPPGEYAVVELMGHTTLAGRIQEVERFGIKMLAIEPIFRGELLGIVFQGGASIYRLTPCTAEVAFSEAPVSEYGLPSAIRATIPLAMLPAIEPAPRRLSLAGEEDDPFEDQPF